MFCSNYRNPFRQGKPGRPRLAAAQRKSVAVVIRLTKRQHARLQSEAEDREVSVAELVRQKCLGKREDDSLADLGLRSSRRGFLNL